jgi:hypothetical protein
MGKYDYEIALKMLNSAEYFVFENAEDASNFVGLMVEGNDMITITIRRKRKEVSNG